MLYIGAVAVIFLFAVMFIDLRLEDTWVDLNYVKNYGMSLIVFFKLLVFFEFIANNVDYFFYLGNSFTSTNFTQTSFIFKFNYFFTDILCISNLLYTHYLLHLVLLSLILWSVMLGSVSICNMRKQ